MLESKIDTISKFKKDKVLSPFIKKWYGMHGSCAQDLYGLLMIGIFLQNTVIKRSVHMTKVMLEKYGIKVKFDGKEVYYFWKPEEINSGWVHVSYNKAGNRKMYLRAYKANGRTVYEVL